MERKSDFLLLTNSIATAAESLSFVGVMLMLPCAGLGVAGATNDVTTSGNERNTSDCRSTKTRNNVQCRRPVSNEWLIDNCIAQMGLASFKPQVPSLLPLVH